MQRCSKAGLPLRAESVFRSSEANLKHKTKFEEHKEHEFGMVAANRRQPHERSNHSFKRTCLRQSA